MFQRNNVISLAIICSFIATFFPILDDCAYERRRERFADFVAAAADW